MLVKSSCCYVDAEGKPCVSAQILDMVATGEVGLTCVRSLTKGSRALFIGRLIKVSYLPKGSRKNGKKVYQMKMAVVGMEPLPSPDDVADFRAKQLEGIWHSAGSARENPVGKRIADVMGAAVLLREKCGDKGIEAAIILESMAAKADELIIQARVEKPVTYEIASAHPTVKGDEPPTVDEVLEFADEEVDPYGSAL
jgi:hypothetical protein